MLNTDLIDTVNSGEAWALVGSGASTDAGAPGWRRLVDFSLELLTPVSRSALIADARYLDAVSSRDYPKAFSRIEAVAGRTELDKAVTGSLAIDGLAPGPMLRHIASWPFRGYLTTNYDGLLERVLADLSTGWVPIGNVGGEIPKLGGGARNVIWHFHGALGMDDTRSRLILTEADYDSVYLEGSQLLAQLRAFFQLHRIVIFGFGFRDEELLRLLRITARYCTPARPAFAFLPGVDTVARIDLREKYNVEAIGYQAVSGSHVALGALLETYGAFTLKRNLRYGRLPRAVPSYDPETAGLMVYNELVLKGAARAGDQSVDALLRARIIAMLRFQGPLSVSVLADDLSAKAALISDRRLAATDASARVVHVADALTAEGLLRREGAPNLAVYALTDAGRALVEDQAARASLLSQQFAGSLLDRARRLNGDEEAALRIAGAAEGFLRKCIDSRALGVAMVRATTSGPHEYHMVALLQALPDYLPQVANETEAGQLVKLVQQILSERDPADLTFIGIALQAQFGVILLGYDPAALSERLDELVGTLFLIDSSTLIYRLARGSTGHAAAKLLLDRLHTLGAPLATTELLAVEVAEHARWALDHIATADPLGYRTFSAAIGRSGYRPNEFLEGYVAAVASGSSTDFRDYLDEATGEPLGHTGADEVFMAACERLGAPSTRLSGWSGFEPELWGASATYEAAIEAKRKQAETYRHERQVQAEAEALVIIEALRDQRLTYRGSPVRTAFFVSPTRLLDDVAGTGSAITMRAEAVLQWLSTVTACPVGELGALTSGLIAELDERGLAIVDRQRLLTVFSPLIEASRDRLAEEVTTNRALIENVYGNEGLRSFERISDLDAPVAAGSYYRQKAAELERQLADERSARESLAERRRLDDKQREELARLQAAEKRRKVKILSKQRAAQQKRRR